MESLNPIVLDHVLNPDHDTLDHPTAFSGSAGNIFCVQCAADRYGDAPDFRKLSLLDGISCVLHAHGASCLGSGISACLDILLRGIDSADPGVVQKATESILILKGEIPDPVGVLVSLVTRIVSLGLPRASGHLFVVGQLLTEASHDPALAVILGRACVGKNDALQGEGDVGRSNCDPTGTDGTRHLRGFSSFLAAHCTSASCPDHVKSDLMYVAMELLDCCTAAASARLEELSAQGQLPEDSQASVLSPGSDPFVGVMLAIPRLLSQGSAGDEPLQLHSIAYLAAAVTYCRQRTQLGAPGWCTSAADVPQVLEELLAGHCSTGRSDLCDIAPRGNVAHHSSPGGLCSALKALLMSSSYRVRSAAARLVRSLCVARTSASPANHEGDVGGDNDKVERFFRETLLAAGTTDFLFEAIKTEREGTVRHYLEAAEALALSPVDFFHASNFSIKFAANVLLGTLKERESRGGAVSCREDFNSRIDCSDKDDDAVRCPHLGVELKSNTGANVRTLLCARRTTTSIPLAFSIVTALGAPLGCNDRYSARVFEACSRLLLQALVASPPPSSSGVVEELLATTSSETEVMDTIKKSRAIGVAADVLSLVASGDIALAKDRSTFVEAVESLLDHIEMDLMAEARGRHPRSSLPIISSSEERSCIASNDQQRFGALPGQEDDGGSGGGDGDGLLGLQVNRVMESLFLLVAQEWVGPIGGLGAKNTAAGRHPRVRGVANEGTILEEALHLTDLVFRAYERTLVYQRALVARSEDIAHVVAFFSCMGAAVDTTSAVLRSRSLGIPNDRNDSMHALRLKPSFIEENELAGHVRNDEKIQDDCLFEGASAGDIVCSGDSFRGPTEESENFTSTDRVDFSTSAAVSCLETILSTTIEEDLVSWILVLYARCYDELSQCGDGRQTGRATSESLDEDAEGCATASGVLAEVLLSLLCAHGCINGLYTDAVDDNPSLPTKDVVSDGQGESLLDIIMGSAIATTREALSLMLRSWTHSCSEADETSLDQHAMSLLGTSADNGNICKLVVLLVSLSSSYLGVLHPHPGCRADCAAKLLRFIKTLPEAIFSLNMFSYAISSCAAGDAARFSSLPPAFAVAIAEVLARFPIDEFAASSIPLSSMALALIIQAGCTSFMSDWVVAFSLDRIRRAVHGLGLPDERHAEENGMMQWNNDEEREKDVCFPNSSRDEYDQPALTGVLNAVVDRWSAELGNGLQHSRAETTIVRLSSVLLLSPDTFLGLAFGLREAFDGQNKMRAKTAQLLGRAIVDTLSEVSSALSSAMLRRGEDDVSNSNRASKLSCAFQVLQLASALLRSGCIHGYYASLIDEVNTPAATCSSLPRGPPLALALARACGGLMRGLLDPHRFQYRSVEDGIRKGGDQDSVLLCALNLFNALLVMLAGDSDFLRQGKQEWALAFEEAHDALSDILSSREMAVDKLGNWFDRAPEILAAFLQACVIWNAAVPPRGANASGDSHLQPPFEVLGEILRLGHRGSCDIDSASGRTERPCRERMFRKRGKRNHILLQLFAARCVESVSLSQPFSSQEAQALQLSLQDVACRGVATLTSAALGAIRALWEAYSGLLHPNELVGQSWNSFVIESCFETAVRLLMIRKENGDAVHGLPDDMAGGFCADFYFEEDPRQRYGIEAGMVLSATGRLVRCSVGKKFPRLRTALASDCCGIEVLSAQALVYMHQCVVLLANDLRMALEASNEETSSGIENCAVEANEEIDVEASHGGDRGAENGCSLVFHLGDALAQLLRVMKCLETTPKDATVSSTLRQEVVDALSQVKPTVAPFEAASQWRGQIWVRGNLPGVVAPFSRKSYQGKFSERPRSFRYDDIFCVKHDQWLSLSLASKAYSQEHDLTSEVQGVIEHLSGSIMAAGPSV